LDSWNSGLIPTIRKRKAEKIKGHINPEQWFVAQLRAYTQRQPRGERTPECPDDSFLHAYAARPGSISLSDPRARHVTSCNHCLPRLLEIRSSTKTARPSLRRATAIAALCGVCLIAGFLGARYWNRQHTRPIANRASNSQQTAAVVDRTLDLTNYGTYRGLGAQPSRPPLNLPAALLHLNLILPRFSQPGAYTIMVAGDRDGNGRMACTTGIATTAGNQTKLTITLDLHGAKPGAYFLLTELSGEQDFYSYQLNIQ
jgi:hypothetical protein